MEDTRLHKYYRAPGYGLNSLIYRFLITDYNLRRFLNLNAYCGAVTFVTFIFAAIIAVCSIASLNTVTSNDALFRELFKKAEKKLPRMKSVVNIIPPYKCIHKHLQRMSVFQEKMKKMLCKEHLELEIMNSKMSCIEKLLKPETLCGNVNTMEVAGTHIESHGPVPIVSSLLIKVSPSSKNERL